MVPVWLVADGAESEAGQGAAGQKAVQHGRQYDAEQDRQGSHCTIVGDKTGLSGLAGAIPRPVR